MLEFKRYFKITVVGLFCFYFPVLNNFVLNAETLGNPADEFSWYFLPVVTFYAKLPYHISTGIQESLLRSNDFFYDLYSILNGDPYLRRLVDKENPLCADYQPCDLVALKAGSYRVSSSHKLRSAAAVSLEKMSAAAKQEGLTMTVLSAFRSYFHQSRIYTYYVRTMGRARADRISARPGYSQHQLGVAVDFNALDNSFTKTAEGIWLAENASRFGWSLSYPDGYEYVTGYSWESWHYRYVGVELAVFIDNYFDGIQQYALRFIHEWEKLVPSL